MSTEIIVFNNIRNFREDLIKVGDKIKIKLTNWDRTHVHDGDVGLFISYKKDLIGIDIKILTEEGLLKVISLVIGDIAEITFLD